MLKVYFKITYIGLLVLTTMLTACSNKVQQNTEAEIYFVNTVEKLMQKKEEIDTDLTNLVKFEWTKVCFAKNEPNAQLTFTNNATKQQNDLDLSTNLYVPEGYVKDSPAKEIYKDKKITIHNCWDRGTLFRIKKFNSTKYGFVITIKGE